MAVIPDPRGGHVWIYGVDDDGNPVKVLVGVDGHVQVDVLSTALPSGAATEATLELVRLLLASLDGKNFATQTTLAALLTELQAKADLAETQPVSAAALPLPSGAATSANQSTEITALQLIDDLRNALASVATDDLRVAPGATALTVQAVGSDKIFSVEERVVIDTFETSTGAASTSVYGTAVPTGKLWVLTHIHAYHNDTVARDTQLGVYVAATDFDLVPLTSLAQWEILPWNGSCCLQEGETVRAKCTGLASGKVVRVRALGYQMDAPS
jgi:hypothetical protein